ncbi:glycerophosphodiester phosphodiesterase family protein [Agarivorans sp. Toyoura001]|uniref:glycerophosphodiester phosphodiesterase n=1 Tax=Agarivorans sp. Toyoura001 TaxID=2283141 RepID=UPI0010F99DA7|nr:glycerophosphodiester phosphodiesterase family protein [Agarivorans sp. Toyoura001]
MFGAYLLVQACWLAVVAPVSIVVSESLMSWYGLQGVANQQLLAFFLSPSGYLFAIWLVAMALFNFFLQQGVITLLLAQHEVNRRSVSQAVRLLLNRSWLIARLAFLQSALLISISCTILFIGRWLFGLMLADWDINYYLDQQRNQLWIFVTAVSVGGIPLALWLGAKWLNWWFALPYCMLQKKPLSNQLRDSTKLSHHQRRLILALNAGWFALRALVFVSVISGFIWLLRFSLSWWQPEEVTSLWLFLFSFAVLAGGSVLSFLDTWLYASIQFYMFKVLVKRNRSGLKLAHQRVLRESRRLHLGLRMMFLAVLVLGANEISDEINRFSQRFSAPNSFVVMGHRAGGWLALENSLEGLQKSINLGLEVTEIDVQLTADGKIAVVHDRDLRRLTADSAVVHLSRFEQVQQAFVNAGFSTPQALPVWLAKSADKITLNIELKRYNDSLALVPALLDALKDYLHPVIISSLDGELLETLKLQMSGTPQAKNISTAFIAAASFGETDVQQNVDMLIVNQQWVNAWRLLSAQQRGQQVHVWTVNSAADVERLYYLRVDGIVTDSPIIALETIERLNQLSEMDHIVNSLRHWLSL